MTNTRLPILALLLVVLLSSGYAYAQQDNSTSENAQATNAALREKAFSLLESVAGQLNTLQSKENRARLGANIVDSLWKHDEKRARALLVLVEEDIKAGLESLGSGEQKDQFTVMVFSKLRLDTVERIARHDGELALAFLKATKPDKPPDGLIHNERNLELRLAKQVAVSNPDVALKLGRKALAEGFHPDLILVLRQLNMKHKDQALVFYKEIVQKLKDLDFADNWDIRYFVQTLAQSFTPPAADDSTFRQLAELITASALANGCGNHKLSEEDGSSFCRWAAATIPQMEKIDPRAAKLKHWAPANGEWEGQPLPILELEELVQDGTVDQILDLASKYPERADHIYWQAIRKAIISGDFEQARKIANGYVPNPEMRRQYLAQIDAGQRRATIDDQKLAEVQTRLNAIERIQDRVWYLLFTSNQFGAADRKTALKLLNQASEIVDSMKPGKEKTQSQMTLAMMYCLEKNNRGLEIMESLVPKLNELVDVATKLDGYDTEYLREGEWNMSANGVVGDLLTRLAQNAGYFAWCDFDRSASLAAQFDRAEIRMMAQVKLAQGILTGPPKRIRQEYELLR